MLFPDAPTAEGEPASHAHVQAEKERSPTLVLEEISNEVQPIDPETARRVLRKIDLFLMPAMVIGMVTCHVSVLPCNIFG